MRIVAGSDHAGLELKGILVEHLRVLGHVVQDVGTHTAESCDYPAFAADVASAITEGQADWGLLCCGPDASSPSRSFCFQSPGCSAIFIQHLDPCSQTRQGGRTGIRAFWRDRPARLRGLLCLGWRSQF